MSNQADDWLNNDEQFSDDPDCVMANDLVDRWFSSNTWEEILVMGELGDKVSIELMSQVSDQLYSLVYHLRMKSGSTRIQYELKYFTDLCDDFGVA